MNNSKFCLHNILTEGVSVYNPAVQ